MIKNSALTEDEQAILDFISDPANKRAFDAVDEIRERVNSLQDLNGLNARDYGILQAYISMLCDPVTIRELKYCYRKQPTGTLKKIIWLCSIPELQTLPDDDPETH